MPRPRLIVSAIEHESILETAKDLADDGVDIVYLPVDQNGIVSLEVLKKELNDRTILVSIMYANNETGAIQPIKEISKIIKDFRREKKLPLFHTDAVQAFQFLNCNVDELGVDLMTLSAHKIYGPKGIGALFVRNPKHEARNSKQIQNSKFKIPNKVSDFGFRISDLQLVKPIVTGGGQEFGLRSGTENVAAIVGFAKAVEIVVQAREGERERVSKLRDYFWQELKKIYTSAELNGGGEKLPNILNIYFPGHKAEDLLIKFDMAGIAISSGSACAVRSLKPSHVLKALGLPEERIRSSNRFSFGKFTTKSETTTALKKIKNLF